MAGSQLIGSPRCKWVPQQFSFWLLELGNSRFEASLPHKCGVPKLAGTPHLCGRAPKMRIAGLFLTILSVNTSNFMLLWLAARALFPHGVSVGRQRGPRRDR